MIPILTDRLFKSYRKTVAVNDVTLSIPAGAVYALVGANGAGKTTLIKLLMNIIRPSSGHASVLGVRAADFTGAIFEKIGYVSENQKQPESMTVAAYLAYMRPFYPGWDRSLEKHLLDRFELPVNQKLKHLSRGTKMKAILTSILAYRPSVIVLDEPFSGLDPLVRNELIESLLERAPESAVLLSSHDLPEAESFATHVGYLEEGRLIFSEEMSALTERFREVEITFPDALAGTLTVSSGLPPNWINPQIAANVLRFVDTQFTTETESVLAARFSQGTSVTLTPMTLRSVFLAMAKTGRAKSSNRARSEAGR